MSGTILPRHSMKDTIDAFCDTVDALLKGLSEMSLPGLVQLNSREIDKQILATERQYGYKYVGGQIKIVWGDATRIREDIELYYQDANGKWVQVKSSDHYLPITALEPSARLELQGKGEVAFEMDHPQVKNV